jgi:hypothetical protein
VVFVDRVLRKIGSKRKELIAEENCMMRTFIFKLLTKCYLDAQIEENKLDGAYNI